MKMWGFCPRGGGHRRLNCGRGAGSAEKGEGLWEGTVGAGLVVQESQDPAGLNDTD